MITPTKTPQELAADFKRQVIQTARRCIALRRRFPNAIRRWLRAQDSEMAVVLIPRPGMEPLTEVWPSARVDELAADITDQEVFHELARRNGEECNEGEWGATATEL